MTAFLFIPTGFDGGNASRVDFGNIASLFAERDEPASRPDAKRHLLRLAMAALLVIVVIGDTLLVARPGALTGAPPFRPAPARSVL